jgi:hypothetical protein
MLGLYYYFFLCPAIRLCAEHQCPTAPLQRFPTTTYYLLLDSVRQNGDFLLDEISFFFMCSVLCGDNVLILVCCCQFLRPLDGGFHLEKPEPECQNWSKV